MQDMEWSASTVVILVVVLVLVAFAVYRAYLSWTGKKSCCGGGSGGKKAKAPKPVVVADTDESHYPFAADFDVRGMTCERCVEHVQNALNGMEGTWATVDLASRTAHVRSKRPVDFDALSAAVENAGYRLLRQDA